MFILPVQSVSTITYQNANNEFQEFCAWLTVSGIQFSSTRVGKYLAIFAALAEAERLGSMKIFQKKYTKEDYYNAVLERAQLMRIFDGLRNLGGTDLVDRLKKSVRSHALYVMDSESRSGRDFSLELDVASKFARAGYEIDFAHDADVSASKDGRHLFVECKRLKSEAQVRDNIKKGIKQLKNRYKTSDDPAASRGMLVLSIGKIVNSELAYMNGADISEVGQKCALYVDDFIKSYSRYWTYLEVDQRTLGVVIILDAPGVPSGHGAVPKVYSIHEVAVTNVVPANAPDHELLQQIAKVFMPRRLDSGKSVPAS